MQYQPHHRVNIKNVQHGDIYWLPPKQLCDSEAQAAMIVDIDDGCYNHPLLIYAVHRKRKEVLALFVSILSQERLISQNMTFSPIDYQLWQPKTRRQVSQTE